MAYCTVGDVQSILGIPGVSQAVDDDRNRAQSPAEAQYVSDMIDMAASVMDMYLLRRYTAAELAGNAWCKWCNAQLAVCRILSRRGNKPPKSQIDECTEYRDMLRAIAAGQAAVPDASLASNPGPAVDNYHVQFGRRRPIRTTDSQSSRPIPSSPLRPSDHRYDY